MKKQKTILVFLTLNFFFFIACKKNGAGGSADVSVTVIHHVKIIPYAIVYVKYGAKDFPGASSSDYDNSIKTDANGHADFTGLRYGDYYFYGVGFDSSLMLPVTGGDHLAISWSDRKKTISFTVPVTE